MLIYYIENEIDLKYQSKFLKYLLEEVKNTDLVSTNWKLYYRKLNGLFNIDFNNLNNTFDFLNSPDQSMIITKITIPKLMKMMNDSESSLVTGYNFRKRGVHKYPNIKVINIGHSISGNTVYNLRAWIQDNKENSFSIIPKFFNELKGGVKRVRLSSNTKLFTNNYYKLIYSLTKSQSFDPKDQILVLPHWTTPIEKLYDMITRIKINDNPILVKLHPASIYETTIFLNRTSKSEPTSLEYETKKSLQKEIFDSYVNKINSIPNVKVVNDDEVELIDAIDQSNYIVFDGHSNTLPESIFRSIYHNQNKKFVVVDPKIDNPSYVLPDLFGYDYIDSVESIEDFKSPDKDLLLSYINVLDDNFIENTIKEYLTIISSIVN